VKVLVTGGAGFIGSHTVDLLLQHGYEVRILDSLAAPVHKDRARPAYLSPEAELIVGDVRNRADMEKTLRGVNRVYHLAAHQGYLPDFSSFASVNDLGTALLYEVIVAGRLPVEKVVIGGTQAVYGEGKYRCAAHGVQFPAPRTLEQLRRQQWELSCPECGAAMTCIATDESRTNPHNQYAVSKYAQELYALTLGRRFGIPTVVLRYSITQGARQSFRNAYSGILRIFTLRMLKGLPPVIYEGGNQLRDYVSVADVAEANRLVMEEPSTEYETYNVGGREVLTVSEYCQLMSDVVGRKVSPSVPGDFRYGDVRHVMSDISKLRALGWSPKRPIAGVIREYVDWAAGQPDAFDHYPEAETEMKMSGTLVSTGGRQWRAK